MEKKSNKNKPNIHDYLSILEQPEDIFTLLYPMGKSKNSIVYKAIHKSSRQTFAIKIINNSNKKTFLFFQNQIDLMKKFFSKSEYIIKYYGSYYSIKSNSLWLILEYCGLGSVMDFLISMNRPYNEIEIATIISMVLKGLKGLHYHNYIYKNLKSSNILITEDGYAKLSETYFEDMKYINDLKKDIFCLGCICIELITGIKIDNYFQKKEIIYKIFKNIYKKNKCSEDFISFLDRCIINEVDQRANVFELLNHPFILNYSKDRKFLVNLIIKCISKEYNFKYSHFNNNYLNIDLQKGENNFYIDKNINNNINNFFLSDNSNKYLCKNYNTDYNFLNKKFLKKSKNLIKNKYNTEKNKNNNYNDFIKKKVLLIPKLLINNKNNCTKGFYINNDKTPNIKTKFKNPRKSNSVLYKSKNKYNFDSSNNNSNYYTNTDKNNEMSLKCEIIKLTPNVKKEPKINDLDNNIPCLKKSLSFEQSIIYQKNWFTQRDNNNKFVLNSMDNLSSFTFGNKKNMLYFQSKQNTYSKPIIKDNNTLFYKPVLIKSYKLNRKIKNDKNKSVENNISNDSNNSEHLNKLLSSFDDIMEINNNKFHSMQDNINLHLIDEMTNKAKKTIKMHKSHAKYFNYSET